MERVTGIGGIFFKAKDPEKLKAWYHEHLGVPMKDSGYVVFKWGGETRGETVWQPFAQDTTYFAPSTAPFMINFRVRDLAAMRDQLRKAGAVVDDKVEDGDFGKFG